MEKIIQSLLFLGIVIFIFILALYLYRVDKLWQTNADSCEFQKNELSLMSPTPTKTRLQEAFNKTCTPYLK